MAGKKSPRRKKKGKRSPTHGNRSASSASLKQALASSQTPASQAVQDPTPTSTGATAAKESTAAAAAAAAAATTTGISEHVNTGEAGKMASSVAGESVKPPAEVGGAAGAKGASSAAPARSSDPSLGDSWAQVDSMDAELAASLGGPTTDDSPFDALDDLQTSEIDALLTEIIGSSLETYHEDWQHRFQQHMPQIRSALAKDGGLDGEVLRAEALADPSQLLTVMTQLTVREKSKIQRRAAALHEQLVAKQTEVSELRAQLPSTAELSARLAAREAELAELRGEQEEAIASHRRQLNQLQDKVCALETERTRVADQLATARLTETQLLEDSVALQRERDHASSSNQEQIDDLEDRSRKAEKAMRASQARLEQLETQLSETRASRDAVHEELTALRASTSEQLLIERRKATDARMALDGFKSASLRRETELQQATDKAIEDHRQVNVKLRAARKAKETLVKEMELKNRQLETTEAGLRDVQAGLARAEEQKLELTTQLALLAQEASDPAALAATARFLPSEKAAGGPAAGAAGGSGSHNPLGSLKHSLTSRTLALTTVAARLDEVTQEVGRLGEENRRLLERRDEESRRLDNLKKKSEGHQETLEDRERLSRKTKALEQEKRRMERDLEASRKREKRLEAGKGHIESEYDSLRSSYYKQGEKMKKLEQDVLELRVEKQRTDDLVHARQQEHASMLTAAETMDLIRERDQTRAQYSQESAELAENAREEVAAVLAEGLERERLMHEQLVQSEHDRGLLLDELARSKSLQQRPGELSAPADLFLASQSSLFAASPMAAGAGAAGFSPTTLQRRSGGSPRADADAGAEHDGGSPSFVSLVLTRTHVFIVFFIFTVIFYAMATIGNPPEASSSLTRFVSTY